jgi:hypothetical protein
MTDIRPIAIYLPQFHPIPENDEWWGKGFTEWTNVTKARPLFKGHYQPHLPADLGFYDLRLTEAREAQAEMALSYGIHGFCYYHYWFNGRRILERPFAEVLQSGKPDFPFMLCWANENWTRTWDGGEHHILLQQNYSEQDHIDHAQSMIPSFKDNRYIKIDGKPVFAIYRSTKIPDIQGALRIWRNECLKHGVELYIVRFESFQEGGAMYMQDGFDAAVGFEPISMRLTNYWKYQREKMFGKPISANKILYKFASEKNKKKIYNPSIVDYGDYVDYILNTHKDAETYKKYPCVTPGWDNSPRKKNNNFIMANSTPEKFAKWVRYEIKNFKPFHNNENIFFINAWNEWAEGNHLEPCQKWGRAYLEALKNAILQK